MSNMEHAHAHRFETPARYATRRAIHPPLLLAVAIVVLVWLGWGWCMKASGAAHFRPPQWSAPALEEGP